MPPLYWKLLLFIGGLFAAALFAFLETALTSLRVFDIKSLAQSTRRYQRLFAIWEESPQRILIAILIASNMVHVLCSVTITDIMQELLGDTGIALAVGVTLATGMILVFGEIIPKTFAKARGRFVLTSVLWVVHSLVYISYPLVSVLLYIANKLMIFLSADVPDDTIISEKELQFLIGYSDKKGVIDRHKIEMLKNVFELGQTLCKEVMVPVTDIVMLEVSSSLQDALNLFARYRFTRIPVYEGQEDNIIGIIHQKDVFNLLYSKQEKPLRDCLLPVLFVPETKRINQLLSEFQEKRAHMAILVDEHGAVMGLVTLEDVIEEIVGDISDEHERVQTDIIKLEDGGWMVDARVDLETLGEVLDITFDVEESVTLGGFLAEQLQHLPKKGERVIYKGFCFQVQRATLKRVQQVLIGAEKCPSDGVFHKEDDNI